MQQADFPNGAGLHTVGGRAQSVPLRALHSGPFSRSGHQGVSEDDRHGIPPNERPPRLTGAGAGEIDAVGSGECLAAIDAEITAPDNVFQVSTQAVGRRRRISPGMFLTALGAGDLIFLLLAACLVLSEAPSRFAALPLERASFLSVIVVALLTAGTLRAAGAYRSILLDWSVQARAIVVAVLGGGAVLWAMLRYLSLDAGAQDWLCAAWLATSAAVLCLARVVSVPSTHRLVVQGRLVRRIAIFGSGDVGLGFIRNLRRNAVAGIEVVGVYDHPGSLVWAEQNDLAFCGGVEELADDVRHGDIDALVLGAPADQRGDVERLRDRIEGCSIDVFRPYEPLVGAELPIGYIGGVPVAVVAQRALSEWQVLHKRMFDWIAAALLLVVFAPVLFGIAVLVRWDSEGPALFRQPRVRLQQQYVSLLQVPHYACSRGRPGGRQADHARRSPRNARRSLVAPVEVSMSCRNY